MPGFGDFTRLCQMAPLPLCASVGPMVSASGGVGVGVGIEPDCFARNFELANTIIFQGAASVMHIMALIMTVIMILHVRGKFTAVGTLPRNSLELPFIALPLAIFPADQSTRRQGRKEINSFFYFYLLLTFLSLLVDAGVVPPGSRPYPYFVAMQAGLSSALVTCLLINGFVGFQLYEDGTALSLWTLRLSSLAAFAVTFLVTVATFQSWAGLGPGRTGVLFAVLYLLNAVQVCVYVALQTLLVVRTLQDRWPLGDIAFGLLFFAAGQLMLYVLSPRLCEATSHYMDGLFFATTCNLLAVMMVYKFWDSITREDLEFSVGTRANNWEVKELLPPDPDAGRDETYRHSAYALPGYDQSYMTSPSRHVYS